MEFTHKVNGTFFRVWGERLKNDGNKWWIATDTDGAIETVSEVVTVVSRSQREDWSGRKKFKVVTKTVCNVVFRLAYKKHIIMRETVLTLGEKAALKELMRCFTADNWQTIVRLEAHDQALANGVDSDTVFMAENGDDRSGNTFADAIRILNTIK